MKRIFQTVILFLAIVHFPHALYAQQHTKTDTRTTGSFEWNATGASQAITAYYSLMPAAPDNLVLQIRATGEFTVNARIIDGKGNELLKVKAAPVMPRYVSNIDISKLVPGQYFVEVSGDKNEGSYRIPFTKG